MTPQIVKLTDYRPPGLPGWLLGIAFVALAITPIGVAATTGLAPTAPIQELATAFGLTGGALLFLQFLSSGRYPTLSGRIGIDRTMGFHRIAAIVLLALVILHPLGYVLSAALMDPSLAWPRLVGMLTSKRLLSGVAAVACLIALVGLAFMRTQKRFRYEIWRASHGIFAMAAAALTLHHVLSVGAYSRETPVMVVWIVFAGTAMIAIAIVYVVRPMRLLRRPWQVHKIDQIASDTLLLELRTPEPSSFKFKAGQFAWLTMPMTRSPICDHPFSIASAPEELPLLRFVIRDVGDFTHHLRRLPPGTLVTVDGPHGGFVLDHFGTDVVMVAGGVGIAPVLGILEEAARNGDPRRFRLLYAERKAPAFVCHDRLRRLQDHLNLELNLYVDIAAVPANMHQGPIEPEHIAGAIDDPHTTIAYVCGPPLMMSAMTDALLDQGVPPHAVRFESFDFATTAGKLNRRRRFKALATLALVVSFALAFGVRSLLLA